MLGSLGANLRSASLLSAAILLVGHLPPLAAGLRTTAGSPCASVCNTVSTNTTSAEIVCIDGQYNTTTTGTTFQSCVECLLDSTYSDSSRGGETDVNWGLYNLRYAFSSCLYNFPDTVTNITSPCIVSCTSLQPALEYNLQNPIGNELNTWCGASALADNLVDQCEFCYNLTTPPQAQIYMANFLESLRYNCHFRTATGLAFAISPTRIFSESLLPSSESYATGTSSGSHINLALVIALPVLGFVIIVCMLTVGCFCFIRHRRKKARRNRHSGHLYARWNDTTISTPGNWGPPQQGHEMYSPGTYQEGGYGFGGFNFVDNDGRGQDVGFSKPHYVDVAESEPGVAVPSTAYSPDDKKDKGVYYD